MATSLIKQADNVGNLIYDSSNSTASGRQRIGTSATEIELLDEMPLSFGPTYENSNRTIPERLRTVENSASTPTRPVIQQRSPQIVSQPLSVQQNRVPPTVYYSDENNGRLDAAVDKLLQKYAPDAIPQSFFTPTIVHEQTIPTETKNISSTAQSPKGPISSTDSHIYSTVIRSKPALSSGTTTQRMPNPPPKSLAQDFSLGSRPDPTFNNFQHASQTNQLPAGSLPSATMPTTFKPTKSILLDNQRGSNTRGTSGQFFNFHDDPLSIFYDRQEPTGASRKQTQVFNQTLYSTFQPATTVPNYPNSSVHMLSSRPQPTITTTINTNSSSASSAPLDLAELIKHVQQDYLRQVQPFVSSIKFVDKSHEFGQKLSETNFETPVANQGFLDRANDILRRSFGQQQSDSKRAGPALFQDESDVDDQLSQILPASAGHYDILGKEDSRHTYSSLTTVSSTVTDLGIESDQESIKPFQTKPLTPISDQSSTPSQSQSNINNPNSVEPMAKEKTPVASPKVTTPLLPTKARRIPSDERYSSSSEASTTKSNEDDDDEVSDSSSAVYNEHEPKTQPHVTLTPSLGVIASANPIVKPNEMIAERREHEAIAITQRSEDIHPIPPVARSSNFNFDQKRTEPIVSTAGESDDDDDAGDTSIEEDSTFQQQPKPSSNVSGRAGLGQGRSSNTNSNPIFNRTTNTPPINSGNTKMSNSNSRPTNTSTFTNDHDNKGSNRFFQGNSEAPKSRYNDGKESSNSFFGRLKSVKNVFRRS